MASKQSGKYLEKNNTPKGQKANVAALDDTPRKGRKLIAFIVRSRCNGYFAPRRSRKPIAQGNALGTRM